MAPRKSHNYLTIDDEESLIALRHYELEAYSAVVTALRAEGQINENKKTILKDLREILGISVERHKAEIRRAANDESLANLANQIQGVPCDDDWQSEGCRLVGVLQRPLPITAYTKIADEVAEKLMKENNKSLAQSFSETTERNVHEKLLHPPVNPQHALNNEIFEDIRKCTEEKNANLPEEESEEAERSDFLDSYVFLPGGTVVKLEPRAKPGEPPTYGVASSHNLKTKESSFKKLEDASSFATVKTEPEMFSETDDAKTERKKADPHSDATKRSFPFSEQSLEDSTVVYSRLPKRHDYSNTRTSSHRLDHLYSTSNNQRAQFLSQSADTSWTTKHNVAAETKSKKRVQRSSAASNSRKLSKSQLAASRRPPSEKRARITSAGQPLPSHRYQSSGAMLEQTNISPPSHSVSIYPKPTSTFRPSSSQLCHRSHDESMFRNEFNPNYQHSSPQRVFRPTMQMTSPSMEKTNVFPSQDVFASSSSPHPHYPIEAGLAPLSAIMSQVSSHDVPAATNLSAITDQILASNLGPVAPVRESKANVMHSPVKAATSVNNQKHFEAATSTSSDASIKPHERAQELLATSHFVKPAVNKTSESLNALKRLHANLAPTLVQPVSNDSSLASKTAMQTDTQTSSPALPPTTEQSHTPSQVESTETNIKAPTSASGPRPLSSLAPAQITATVKPTLSTANIIKVTPRPLVGTKGIVTQLAGARITKAFGGTGNAKPSIIVVRQAPRKTVVTAPTKVVDADNKTSPRTVSVTTSAKPSMKPTTILRPVTAKVSVRDSPAVASSNVHELPTGGSSLHKVITKGKMRQLVLKSTSSSVLRHTSQDSSGLFSSFASRPSPHLVPSFEGSSERPSASPIRTASTTKAPSALQKGSPFPLESTGSTFSHTVASKPNQH